jgi:hypothetical protein
MIAVTKDQALERWDILPLSIREALYSQVNLDFLWKTCREEHILDEKINTVGGLAACVFFGFLHPEDLAGEIRDALGIDLRIAAAIASSINQRLFTPLRADIDKIYAPAAKPVAPKILEEIRPTAKQAVVAGAAPKPLSTIPTPIKSTPMATPAPLPKQEPNQTVVSDEFARLKTAPPAPIPPPTPAPAKPIVFQTESVSRPIANAPDFRVPTIAQNIMGKKGIEPLPVRSAVIELGGVPIPKTTPPASSPMNPGLRMAAMPPRPEPMRTITEITPQTLKAEVSAAKTPPAPPSFAPLAQIPIPSPMAPKPSTSNTPMPPKPSTPAASMPPASTSQIPKPPQKVAQKDYSA